MVEKKKATGSQTPKAARKPRAKKEPAAVAPSPEVSSDIQQNVPELAVPAGAESSLSDAEREALKAELRNEIAELKAMLKKAATGYMDPWKMPW